MLINKDNQRELSRKLAAEYLWGQIWCVRKYNRSNFAYEDGHGTVTYAQRSPKVTLPQWIAFHEGSLDIFSETSENKPKEYNLTWVQNSGSLISMEKET